MPFVPKRVLDRLLRDEQDWINLLNEREATTRVETQRLYIEELDKARKHIHALQEAVHTLQGRIADLDIVRMPDQLSIRPAPCPACQAVDHRNCDGRAANDTELKCPCPCQKVEQLLNWHESGIIQSPIPDGVQFPNVVATSKTFDRIFKDSTPKLGMGDLRLQNEEGKQ